MREIKFKAWDTKDKFMMDDVYFRRVNLDLIPFKRSQEGPRWTVNLECKDIIILQYTGLKDKNGKEIYEGDIIRSISNMVTIETNKPTGKKAIQDYEVFYLETEGRFARKNIERNKIEPFAFSQNRLSTYYEIIGNIYENPELLK